MVATERTDARQRSTVDAFVALFYGAFSYLAFVAVFLYGVGFLADIVVPRTVDNGGPTAGTAMTDGTVLVSSTGVGITALLSSTAS
jgi:hypothetical protein